MHLIVFLSHDNDKMTSAVLSIGSNLGDRHLNLRQARFLLLEAAGTITLQSSIYETEPWGFDTSDHFLNQVILLETKLSAVGLIETILEIEKQLGRERTGTRYASRIIDIDILFFGEEVILSNNLIIPHPLVQERKFILVPLCEIMPEFIHPVFEKKISDLLIECSDQSEVKDPVEKLNHIIVQ